MHFIILAQSELSGRVLRNVWCRLLHPLKLNTSTDVEKLDDSTIVFEGEYHHLENVTRVFESLTNSIESRIGAIQSALRSDITVLVDAIDASDLSLVAEGVQWSSIVAMLIVAYPDLNWVFGHTGRGADHADFPDADHNRFSVFRSPRNQLFDASGLRNWIRRLSNADLKKIDKGEHKTPFQIAERKELAAVIEDEAEYAMIHAYAAYRFGFRTDSVTTWEQMKDSFRYSPDGSVYSSEHEPQEIKELPRLHRYRLILEDIRLQFADKPAKVHLSKPDDRGRHCNLLADINDRSEFRFCISTGQESDDAELWAEYEAYLYNKSYGLGKLLAKPIGGPIELWRESGLKHLLYNGHAEGFESPPDEMSDELYDGHGAPGKIALVASKLIGRARKLTSSAQTPSEFIVSAVLANDAFELLGGKTPTLAVEALKLKIVSEVRAECAFAGTGFHFDLEDRFTEIDRFVNSICRWYTPPERKYCEWDMKAAILNELVSIYRDSGNMEEEDQCLAEFRWCNRNLQSPKYRTCRRWNPLSWIFHGVLMYAEFLLVGLHRITASFAIWILLFAAIAWVHTGKANPSFYIAKQLNWMVGGGAFDADIERPSAQSKTEPVTKESSVITTTTDSAKAGQTKNDQNYESFFAPFSILSNIVGAFHFGILMSYFYGLISRK